MSVAPQKQPPFSPEAIEWFNRRRAGDMGESETRAFEVWLGRGEENRAEFRQLEQNWLLLGGLEDDPAIMTIRDRVDHRILRRGQSRIVLAAVAGVALLAIGGWALVRGDILQTSGWFTPAPSEEFNTGVGQRKVVTLRDGSVVTLDTDTLLRTQITGGKRRVTLERGQASFQVAKDKSRPFIVAAAGKTVHATGTVFDVRVESGRFEVTLIEGRVRVQEDGASKEDGPLANMRPGWKLAIGEDTRWRMEPVDLVRETSWHDGVLMFHDEPLANAVAEMNRYSRRRIVFNGPPPATFVMGNFTTGDIDNFVRAIKLNRLARVVSDTDDAVELAAR